jgi:hypothetical protein
LNETPPPRYCSRHPHGSGAACRLCDHAGAAYAEWRAAKAQALLNAPTPPPQIVVDRYRPPTAATAQHQSLVDRLHIGTPDPDGSHRGYLAATAELTRLRSRIAAGDKQRTLAPHLAVCLDCGRPGPIAHLTMDDKGETRCTQCWAGETARALAISVAIDQRAGQL